MIDRYTRPAMAKVWSDDNRMRVMLRVEEVFLEILAAEKGISGAELKTFQAVLHRSLMDEAKAKEASAGHEVIGLLAAVAEQVKDKAPQVGRYLHYGLTS